MAIWEKLFNKITFKDYPDTTTPLNASNMNTLSNAIDGIDDRVVELNSNLEQTNSNLETTNADVQSQFNTLKEDVENKIYVSVYDKPSIVEFSYATHGDFINPIMRYDGNTVIETIPNTGEYKIIACEPYLYQNSVWKLKVSFYANGSVVDMFFTQD